MLYRERNYTPERLSKLPKVTQQGEGRIWVQNYIGLSSKARFFAMLEMQI